jgi:putative nucleotidyltransferase with HDIG domain
LIHNDLDKKENIQYASVDWKYSKWIRLTVFILFYSLMVVALCLPFTTSTYDIQVGSASEKTIIASKQVENKRATTQLAEAEANRTLPIYQTVAWPYDELIQRIYEKIEQINRDQELKTEDKVTIFRLTIPQMIADLESTTMRNLRDQQNYSKDLLSHIALEWEEQRYLIPEELYFKLPLVSQPDLKLMKKVTQDITAKFSIEPIIEADYIRKRITEQVNSSDLTKHTTREITQELIRIILAPNTFIDQSATDQAKYIARENVRPIWIQKGDIVVNKGDLITDQIYENLKSLDVLKAESNLFPITGMMLIAAILTILLYLFIRQSQLPVRKNNEQLIMLLLIILVNIMIMFIFSWFLDASYLAFITPVTLGSILIAILLDSRLALFSTVFFAICASIVFQGEYTYKLNLDLGFFTLLVCAAAVCFVQRVNKRSHILRVGLLNSFIGMLVVYAMYALEENILQLDLLLSLTAVAIGGLLAIVLVFGLLPFFELTFGILSPLRLVELANPNHPLLRKLLTETPGTYHHSIMVGNLAEAAAESIGADGLLCRVGAFYHDVGKTKRPSYFIENQTNIENPHDHIVPMLSRSIIIAHVREGVDMLEEYKIPKAIRDIAEQHHGTSLLHYFYHKAIKRAEEEGIEQKFSEQDFRYPGPKAQTKEAAIIGIADSVEASVRSLRNPTLEEIHSMVNRIIKSRLDDGQFHESDLTLKELDTIARTLNETLLGIFHSRIEYPPDPL